MKTKLFSALLIVASVLALSLSSVTLAAKPLVSDEVGSRAYSYIEALTFAPRVAGTEEEFASLACLLAFDRGGYITGTAINVDGGLCPVA